MATEDAYVIRVYDTEANLLSTSRTIKKQLSGATDTDRIIYHKNDDSFLKFGGTAPTLYWTQQTGYVEPAGTYDSVQLQGAGNFGIRKTPSSWGASWNALEIGTGIYSIGLAQAYDSTDGAFYYGNLYHNGTNWTKTDTNRTAAIQRTDDDDNPGLEINESPAGTGTFSWANMYEFKKDYFRIADGSNRILEVDSLGLTIGGTGYRDLNSKATEINLVKESYLHLREKTGTFTGTWQREDNVIRVRVNDGTTTIDGYILTYTPTSPP